jgi:class 3 adenylate cyclase/tetratricopeptide (TPR) repeat protein
VPCPKCGDESASELADCPKCGALSCVECGAPLSAAANFCSHCGKTTRRTNWPPTPYAESVSPPPLMIDHVLASRTALEGERKQVTVLFADLRGSLGVLAGLDPEDAQALLDAVVATMVEAVHRYEGAVNQTMGDGIMALFGAPIAHEDHALRAACAALAMQDAVRAMRDPTWEARGARPQIRVGLHSGEVAIRTVRNDLSMEYRAVGQTTHIAARMEQLAAPGKVWLTYDTFKLGQGLLRASPMGPMTVRGVPNPIEVYELEGISVRTRFQANALRGLSALVAREDLLGMLRAQLERTRDGHSRVAVLRGDPGVGKSRLCYELLHRSAADFRVLEAASLSYLSRRPYALLASIVRALFGIDDGDDRHRVLQKARRALVELGGDAESRLPAVLELLDVPSGDRAWAQLDPLQRRSRLVATLRALLTDWAGRGPCVLLCEDLHWCDPDSLEFIAGLVNQPPGAQLLLLITHRPELSVPWRASEHVFACDVCVLDTAAAETLLTNLLGCEETLAPLRRWLALRTGGNPFFLEESARTLIDNGLLGESVNEPANVPASIEALLNARVDRLSEAALDVLQAAAVLGDNAPVELLREIVQLTPTELAARLDVLRRAELMYEATGLTSDPDRIQAATATIRFKHALIQEVVYKRLIRARRRALHARVVEVVEHQSGQSERLPEQIERLAEHTYRAELWARCTEYQRLACARAAGRGANTLAIAHLERGLEALSRIPTGDPERSRAAIDLRLTALAALMPSGAHEWLIQLLREATVLASELQDVGRLARVSSQLSAELWVTARYDEARKCGEQALALTKRLGDDQFALETAIRYNLAMVDHAQANYEAARQNLRELLSRFTGKAERRRMGWAGYPTAMMRTFVIAVSSMTGTFAEAARAYEEGIRQAEQLDHGFSRTMLMEQYAMCLLVQADFERAAALLERAVEICQRDEVHAMWPASTIHLGGALLELGAIDRAAQLIESVDEPALARAGHYATVYKLIALSELQRRRGLLAEARQTAERAQSETKLYGERGFHVQALIQLADVLAELPEERERALRVYGDALDQATTLGMRPWMARAWHGIARAHDARNAAGPAAAAFRSAIELWSELEAPKRVASISVRPKPRS